MKTRLACLLLISTVVAHAQISPDLQSAADQGDAEAQFKVGTRYDIGNGVPRDDAKALLWYQKAANQGNADGEFGVGGMYLSGHGVPKDYDQAMQWFTKSAGQGNADAETVIGSMYESGTGVPKDYDQALVWFRKAADQGNSLGQDSMGCAYFFGQGVPQDYGEALSWFKKAATHSDADAEYRLGFIYYYGHGVPPDRIQGRQWYKKAAEDGNAKAQSFMGYAYDYGDGVMRDPTQAAQWYEKAAIQGDADAEYEIGRRYENGEGVPKAVVQAEDWYKRAAEQGNRMAQSSLVLLYDNAGDYLHAMEWIRKESDQGDSTATYWIGDRYERGIGMPKDQALALQWYEKAANQGNADAKSKVAQLTAQIRNTPSPLIGKKVSLTLTNGEVKAGKIVKVEPDGINILTDDGGGKIPYEWMTDADKVTYGYKQQDQSTDAADAGTTATMPSAVSSASTLTTTEAAWHQVAQFSGSNDKNTEPFAITSKRWRVKWASKGKAISFPETGAPTTDFGVLGVFALDGDGISHLLLNKIGSGSDVTEMEGAGTWSLKIHSANTDWSMVVEEFK